MVRSRQKGRPCPESSQTNRRIDGGKPIFEEPADRGTDQLDAG